MSLKKMITKCTHLKTVKIRKHVKTWSYLSFGVLLRTAPSMQEDSSSSQIAKLVGAAEKKL